ncbi:MAG: divergent polysaccharide deacetylase family protein [Pseudomonadota bacterium]
MSASLAIALSALSPLQDDAGVQRIARAPAPERPAEVTETPAASDAPRIQAPSVPTTPTPQPDTSETAQSPASPATSDPAPAATPAPAPAVAPEPVQPEPEPETQTAAPEPTAPAEPAEDTQVAILAPQPEPEPAPEPEPEPEQQAEPTPEPEIAPAPGLVDEGAPAPAPSVINELPPFKANAEIYNGDRSQPLLSIVIVADPGDQDLMDEILLMPGPLTVVVPGTAADLENSVIDVRDAGFEALVGVEASAASEFEAKLSAPAEVVGAALISEDGAVTGAEAIAPLLEAKGMGLLDASADGGGAPFRAARSLGVPSIGNGRYFDNVPSSAMVFQSLERAAFDARRTGAFVVMGRASPQVLTGLRRWMNVKADKAVNVAPISVVMDKAARQ